MRFRVTFDTRNGCLLTVANIPPGPLLVCPDLLLNLRHKITEIGGPKRTARSMGRISGTRRVALLFQREPDS